MNIEIIAATPAPMDVISRAAGTCYDKDDTSRKRVETCYKRGHMSVFEHACATFRVDGISRACSHQLVRHRLASYSQLSQRYCEIDTSGDWYVIPPTMDDLKFHEMMLSCATRYEISLNDGVRPEDARYLLPEATKTAITMTMNCRELYHFLDIRQDKAAQWEIRELAQGIENALRRHHAQWRDLMDLRSTHG